MASPETLNFDQLLAPIPGENPAGVNLREDTSPGSVYQMIKGAISKARAAWRKKIEGDSGSMPDWAAILEIVPDTIAGKTKDLEIAAWLIEPLLQEHGFSGLRDGFRLARELAEKYWENLHPLPDEEGVGNRVAALAGLNGFDREGILIDEIYNIPLTEEGAPEGPFVRWQYRQADEVEAITDPDKKQKRIDSGAVTKESIQKAEAGTSAEFCGRLLEDLSQCLEELEKLTKVLEEKCGKDSDGQPLAPPTGMIRDALKDCRGIIEGMAAGKVPAAADGKEGESRAGETGGTAAGAMKIGAIGSRNEAFQALLRVARFFKETEPHSPISYALERAVRWGKMALPDLLAELIAEEGARSSVFKLVGIPEAAPPPEPPAS